MRRWILLPVAIVLLAGCGSQSKAQHVETVHSLAAEGALLADGVADDRTLDVFTREHAAQLRKLAEAEATALEGTPSAEKADDVAELLGELEDADADDAARIADELREAAK